MVDQSENSPPSEPYEIMSIDPIGGFAGNRSPNRCMYLLVDHFTRKAFVSTTKNQTTEEIVDLLERTTSDKGVRILLADQYSALNSTELKNYLQKREIQVLFTSVNCASSNGLNERLNQTLVNRIRCKLNAGSAKAWTSIAKECVNEYNRSIDLRNKILA